MADPIVSPGAAAIPSLPSTADQVPYVPVSFLAVAAGLAAGTLILALLGFGLIAYRDHKPLIELELFTSLAVAAVVLSFAARRVVRNSEGTRTGTLFGIDLPNAAWWTGVVLGLSYATYMFAVEYSIRKDAEHEVKIWLDYVQKGDPESLNRAFHRCQEVGLRRTVRADDGAAMETRWRDNYVAFQQCDLVLASARNPGTTFELGGLRDWSYTPAGVECVFTATMTNAEGVFPIRIPLRAPETRGVPGETGGRQWQVVFQAAGFIQPDNARITPYGWNVMPMAANGGEFGRTFTARCGHRESRPQAILDSAVTDPALRAALEPYRIELQSARLAMLGGAVEANASANRVIYDTLADRFSTLPGGAAPSADQKQKFRDIWNGTGFNRVGERYRENSDQHDRLTFTDSRIELRIPVEIALPSIQTEIARGRLLLVCTDTATIARMKELRDSASPSNATTTSPEGFQLKSYPWKVLRLESDLKPVPIGRRPPSGRGPAG